MICVLGGGRDSMVVLKEFKGYYFQFWKNKVKVKLMKIVRQKFMERSRKQIYLKSFLKKIEEV